jgi:hypothetical protein
VKSFGSGFVPVKQQFWSASTDTRDKLQHSLFTWGDLGMSVMWGPSAVHPIVFWCTEVATERAHRLSGALQRGFCSTLDALQQEVFR